MKTILLSSLVKVFKDSNLNFKEYTSASCLKNEKFSYQIAVIPSCEDGKELNISVSSPLKDYIKLYEVVNIPAGKTGYDNSDKFHYDLTRKEFPDLLKPVKDKIKIKPDTATAIWVEFAGNGELSGKHNITIVLKTEKETVEKTFSLEIIDKALPKQELLFTNWFHNDCLCTYYKVKPFSDEYWVIFERFLKNAVEHGVNMILTPVFTPPLDTEVGGERPTVQLVDVEKKNGEYSFGFENFRKYVEICLKNGVEAFEISHFFTQWGATSAPKIVATVNGKEKKIFGWETKACGKAYKDFLNAFAKAFTKEVVALGIKDRCWLHVSDEPNEKQISSYKKAAKILREAFPDFNNLDALSEIEFYKKGLVKTPVCCEDKADIFRKQVDHFWTYYCCGQVDNLLPNRMFSQPSLRNRVLGILLYKYDAEGFLHWGHNFWYSQYSKYEINPYKVTDAGNAFPSGDAFVVYPGKNGEPLNSLRHEVFYDGFQDLRALRLLEKLTSREEVIKLIEEGLDIPLNFNCYPTTQEWLLNLREKVNNAIKENS